MFCEHIICLQTQSVTLKSLTPNILSDVKDTMLLFSCYVWPFWDHMDYSLSGSSVHGISQARILEWVAFTYSRVSSPRRDWAHVSCIGRVVLSSAAESCLSLGPHGLYPSRLLCHGIFQARIVEWVANTTPGDIPDPGIELSSLKSPALAVGFFTTELPWKLGRHFSIK